MKCPTTGLRFFFLQNPAYDFNLFLLAWDFVVTERDRGVISREEKKQGQNYHSLSPLHQWHGVPLSLANPPSGGLQIRRQQIRGQIRVAFFTPKHQRRGEGGVHHRPLGISGANPPSKQALKSSIGFCVRRVYIPGWGVDMTCLDAILSHVLAHPCFPFWPAKPDLGP